MSKNANQFGGFVPPVSNYFRMPNEWVNISAKINNLAELKVVEYVLRHTWGYQEYDGKAKPITVDEFMNGRKHKDGTRMDDGTGLSKPSVIQGLKYAIEHGYLICEVDDADRARIVKAYALKMLSSESEVKDLYPTNRGKDPLPQGSNIFTPEVKDLYCKGKESLPRSEKETKERNSRKTLKERKNGTPNVTTSKEASHSSIHSSLSSSQISSSQETKPKEVTLTEEEQAIYEFGKQTLFKANPPKKTPKLQGECAEIAKHVQTVEQFQSLLQFVRALPYIQGQIHLKNLVNGLDGWLQSLEEGRPSPSSRTKPRGPMVAQEVTAEDIERARKSNAEAIAKMKARNAAMVAKQQEGVKA